MKLWDTIRTAFALAQRVEALERSEHRRDSEHVELVQEWTDFLDKQVAREERERKRAQRTRKSDDADSRADATDQGRIGAHLALPQLATIQRGPEWYKAALWKALREKANGQRREVNP